MRFKFWGVRGSIATPGPSTVRYGGNTTCIEIRGASDELVILDAGTGIFQLGNTLAPEFPININIFFKIYDMNGKEIRTLHNGYHNSGRAAINWDGKDKNNQLVSSGIYYYSIVSGRNSLVKKLTLVK